MRDSFILYTNYFDIFKNIPNEDCGIIFKAILNYTKNDIVEIPEHLDLAFRFIKNQLDVDGQKYDETVEKRRANAKLGGAPKGNSNARKSKEIKEEADKQKQPNAKNNQNNQMVKKTTKNNQMVKKTTKTTKNNHNVTVTDNDNVTVTDTDTDTDNVINLSHDKTTPGSSNEKSSAQTFANLDDLEEREKKILFDFVKKQGARSPRAYIKKLLENGDFKSILNEETERLRKLKAADEREPPNPPRAPSEEEIKNVREIIAKIKRRGPIQGGDDG